MDKFHRGMRRITIAIWVMGCVIAFFNGAAPAYTAATIGVGVGYIAGWSLGWWLFAFVVRWIWLGFFGKDSATS